MEKMNFTEARLDELHIQKSMQHILWKTVTVNELFAMAIHC